MSWKNIWLTAIAITLNLQIGLSKEATASSNSSSKKQQQSPSSARKRTNTNTSKTAPLAIQQNELAPGAKVYIGGYWENERKIFGELDAFLALYGKDNTLFFVDLRAIDFKGPGFEGNAGLGVRTILENRYLLGVYGFFDRKKSPLRNYFNQFTFGLEGKTDMFSLTANGYVPFGKSKKKLALSALSAKLEDSATAGFKNILVTYDASVEAALYGADLEFGAKAWDCLELFVGGFYFNRRRYKAVAGPMARAVVDLGKLARIKFVTFELEGKIRYDRVRKTEGYVGGRMVMHFGQTDLKQTNPLVKRLYDRVRRDLDVVAEQRPTNSTTTAFAKNASGNPLLVKIATDEDTLDEGIAQADLIGVQGEITTAGTKTMRVNQAITGGNYEVDGVALAIGENGKITTTSHVRFTLAQNNKIQDMSFESPNTGIPILGSEGTNIGHLIVKDCVFNAARGLQLKLTEDSLSNIVTVTGCTFTGVASQYALYINGDTFKQIHIDKIENNKFLVTHLPVFIASAEGTMRSFSDNVLTSATSPSGSALVTIEGLSQIDNIKNNNIQITPSTGSCMGIKINSEVDGTIVPLVVTNLIGNNITSMGAATNLTGIDVPSGNTTIGQNGGMYNNAVFNAQSSGSSIGFRFVAGAGTKINVYVNNAGLTLPEANPTNANTAVSTTGDIVITP